MWSICHLTISRGWSVAVNRAMWNMLRSKSLHQTHSTTSHTTQTHSERERERERERECVCVHTVRERERKCVCVCVREREREKREREIPLYLQQTGAIEIDGTGLAESDTESFVVRHNCRWVRAKTKRKVHMSCFGGSCSVSMPNGMWCVFVSCSKNFQPPHTPWYIHTHTRWYTHTHTHTHRHKQLSLSLFLSPQTFIDVMASWISSDVLSRGQVNSTPSQSVHVSYPVLHVSL